MKLIWILVFMVLAGAGLLLVLQGASYLLAAQDNALLQGAAASLATAHFVAGWLCWWLAAGANRQYGALADQEWDAWDAEMRGKTTWEQRKS